MLNYSVAELRVTIILPGDYRFLFPVLLDRYLFIIIKKLLAIMIMSKWPLLRSMVLAMV